MANVVAEQRILRFENTQLEIVPQVTTNQSSSSLLGRLAALCASGISLKK